jgi:hypothetical protein
MRPDWRLWPLRHAPGATSVYGMSKYSALRDWLRITGTPTVTVSFDRLVTIVPGGLPASAFEHDAWWSNETGDTRHVRASPAGWLPATESPRSTAPTGR